MGGQGSHDRAHLLLPFLSQRRRCQVLLEGQMDEAVLPAAAVEEEARVLPHVRQELLRRPLGVPLLALGEDALEAPGAGPPP